MVTDLWVIRTVWEQKRVKNVVRLEKDTMKESGDLQLFKKLERK